MKKYILRTLALCLALCSCVIASAYSFVVDGIAYNILSSTEKTVAVTYLENYRNTNRSDYTGDIVIPETVTHNETVYTVTSIGDYAFQNCSSLTSVDLSNVTFIEYSAFSGCSSLASVDLSNVTFIGSYAFNGCSNISSLRIGSVEQWCRVSFSNEYASPLCSSSKDVDLYIGDSEVPATEISSENVTAVPAYAFRRCSKIIRVNFPNATSIGNYTFSYCSSMTSVDLPSVTSFGSFAFQNCSSLTSVDLSNVTTIGSSAFQNCSSLTSVDLSNVTSIGGRAFEGCFNIISLRIGSVEQWCSVSFANEYASPLRYTNKDVDLYIGDSEVPATEISSENVTAVPASAFCRCPKITRVNFPDATSIGSGAFSGCFSLASVDLPSATSIGDYAFSGCSSLSGIDFPCVTSLEERAFYGCSSLTSIDLSNVSSIGREAFQNCSSLSSIDLSNVTSIGSWAFYGCSNISSLRIGSVEQWCKVSFADSFASPLYCSHIDVDLYIGDSEVPATEISSENVTAIPANAFQRCSKITRVNFPNATSIGNYAFSGCSSLAGADLSNATSIGGSAFSGCSSLSSVDLSSVTSIGNYAFSGCSSFSSLRIGSVEQWCCVSCVNQYASPLYDKNNGVDLYVGDSDVPATEISVNENVERIPQYAFTNTKIHSIHFEGTTPPMVEDLNAFTNFVMLVVPESAYETYLAADKFKEIPLQITVEGNTTVELADVEADDNTSAVQRMIGENNLKYVVSLTISGTINSYDMMIIRNKMTSLRNLDLTNARIVDCAYEYYSGCHSVTDVVGPYWFTNTKLMNVKLPSTAKVIGAYLFNECKSLVKVEIPDGITAIGSCAFNGCENVEGLRIPEGVVSVGRCAFGHCDKLKELVIPVSLKIVPDYLFAHYRGGIYNAVIKNLQKLYLPSTVKSIGRLAFGTIENLYIDDLASWMEVEQSCSYYEGLSVNNLFIGENSEPTEEIVIPDGVKQIKQGTFRGFHGLKKITLPESLEEIGSVAFCRTNISEIKLPEKIKSINSETFSGCSSLSNIQFNDSIKSIGNQAFGYCPSLAKVELPPFLETISPEAFYGCSNLEEVLIPAGIQQIGNSAFDGCPKLNKVIATTVEPISINQETFGSVYRTADVYAPKTSYDNYYWDTQWSQFLSVKEYDQYYGESYKYKYFYLNGDFKLDRIVGRIHGCPKADFHVHCGFIVTGDEVQELDSICLKSNGHDGASIIGHGNIHAKKVTVEIDVKGNKWHFFYFPVDIALKDVKYAGSHVWYYYDGEARAENGSGGWKRVTGNTLEAGRGYIFQGSRDGKLYVGLEEHTFHGDDKHMALHTHISQRKNDASWNLIGNPFVSYFGIETLDYQAPITIYNNETGNYETVRKGDDDYDFHPFQAFFVQKPDAHASLDFAALYRQTKTQKDKKLQQRMAERRNAPAADSPRKLINLSLAQDSLEDRTRIVVNPEKAESYEVDCDAAKFLADDMPQIYSVGSDGAMYAINERCLGNGVVKLAVKAPKKGLCTISASRMDCGATLRDRETGAEVDLGTEDYQFLAEATTYANRFELLLAPGATGLAAAEALAEDVSVENGALVVSGTDREIQVFSLGGALVATQRGSGSIKLASGTYIVKMGDQTKKVVVKN